MGSAAIVTAIGALRQDEPALDEVVPEGLGWEEWALAAGVLVAFVVAGRLVRMAVERAIRRSDNEGQIAHFVGRLVQNVLVVVGFMYALNVLGVQIGPLIGALGIGGIAIAFALQAILENAFASVVLKTRKPIAIGDEISTNDHSGRVEEINFRTVVLRNFDGETAILPSSLVNSSAIVNHTERGIRRTVLVLGVAYDTDLRAAQAAIVDTLSDVDGVLAQPAPQAWVTEFADSSINFDVRYWHGADIATTFRVRSDVAMAVKETFDALNIEIPFPQRVVTMVPDA